MKDSENFFVFIAGAAVALLLFFGIVTAIKKSFSLPGPERIDSSQMVDEQKRHSQDIMDRQKRSMEDQKQRIRDLQHR
ncbi:MAG: hypothetical protein HZA28_08990 [Candidatus Omnitrophica bacterium]|nr:hypothetical protein [Candidatus Omnitrophota bacterium]